MDSVSDAEIVRSREDPRFKQVLLARSLEQLLASLHRLQHSSEGPGTARHLREGALIAVQLADRIRAIEDQLSSAKSAPKTPAEDHR
jgi:hypothetical protein